MTNTIKLMLAVLLALAFTLEYTFVAVKHVTVFTIVLFALTTQAVRYIYKNRQGILDTIGEPFIYHSPTTYA